MSWFGKLTGGALGLLMGGPVGAALGAALGHQFDQSSVDFRSYASGLSPEAFERVQQGFVMVLFQIMGHIAKADGRVCEREIRSARDMMDRLNLTESDRQSAMRLFNEGKQAVFAMDAALRFFSDECAGHPQVIRFFIRLETEAALAGGSMHPEKERILLRLCDELRFSRYEYFGIRTRLETELKFDDLGRGASRSRGYDRFSGDYERMHRGRENAGSMLRNPTDLQEAYAELGLTASATPEEIKRAYRRAISRNHPDKLTAAGVSPERIQRATQITQRIQKAYEAICRARSI